MRYTCVGTCVMSRTAAAVVKLTCPDTSSGYLDECGSVDVVVVLGVFLAGSAGGVGGEVSMVVA